MKIYKYPLGLIREQELVLPWGATILSVQMQNGQPCLWASVSPGAYPVQTHHIYCIGTGFDMPQEPTTFLGTVQDPPFVWHYFRRM